VSGQDERHPLDDRPDCGRPLALVLAVLGGPDAPGGGAFRSCTDCGELYARAGDDRRRLDRWGYRMLAREVLRLRALVPPAQRDERDARRELAEEGGDPALPQTIGEAAERNRRRPAWRRPRALRPRALPRRECRRHRGRRIAGHRRLGRGRPPSGPRSVGSACWPCSRARARRRSLAASSRTRLVGRLIRNG
jgi:hypothetical protein